MTYCKLIFVTITRIVIDSKDFITARIQTHTILNFVSRIICVKSLRSRKIKSVF